MRLHDSVRRSGSEDAKEDSADFAAEVDDCQMMSPLPDARAYESVSPEFSNTGAGGPYEPTRPMFGTASQALKFERHGLVRSPRLSIYAQKHPGRYPYEILLFIKLGKTPDSSLQTPVMQFRFKNTFLMLIYV